MNTIGSLLVSWSFQFSLGRRRITVSFSPWWLGVALVASLLCFTLGQRQALAQHQRQAEVVRWLKHDNAQLRDSLAERERERDEARELAEARAEELWRELERRERELQRLWRQLGKASPPAARAGLSARAGEHPRSRYRALQARLDHNAQQLRAAAGATRSYLRRIRPAGVPCQGEITSGFGPRWHPLGGGLRAHQGCDVTAPSGTEIRATAEGTVVRADWLGGYGNTVEIAHGLGFQTLYAHCQELRVKPGQTVRRGQVIATVGSTGLSSGPHCHYEVHRDGVPVDPKPYLKEPSAVGE